MQSLSNTPEEEGLACAWQRAHNPLNLGLKAHIKHAVCLIQH